jgi:hypothetical protein
MPVRNCSATVEARCSGWECTAAAGRIRCRRRSRRPPCRCGNRTWRPAVEQALGHHGSRQRRTSEAGHERSRHGGWRLLRHSPRQEDRHQARAPRRPPARTGRLRHPRPPRRRRPHRRRSSRGRCHRRVLRAHAALAAEALDLVDGLADDAMLWVAWPRKAAGHVSDIAENDLRELFLPLGVVDVKVAALGEDWSGLKFVRRRANRRT